MSLKARSILFLIAGLMAGALVWDASCRSNLLLILPHLRLAASHPNFSRTVVGLITGGTLGLFLGVADALCVDAVLRRAASALGGLALGALAGVLALIAAPIVPSVAIPVFAGPLPAAGSTLPPMNAHAFLMPIVAWAIIGIAIALVTGAIRKSWRIVIQAAGGAVLGALIGALASGIVNATMLRRLPSESPAHMLVSIVLNCASIALFLSLMPLLFKHAALRATSGKSRGKEYFVASRVFAIGSGGGVDAFAPGVRGASAIEERTRAGYRLRPAPGAAVTINGIATEGGPLYGGDVIGVGDATYLFDAPKTARRPDAVKPVSAAVPATVAVAEITSPNLTTEEPKMPAKPFVPAETAAKIPVATETPANSVPVAVTPSPAAPAKAANPDGRGVFDTAALALRPANLTCLSGPYAGHVFALPPGTTVTIGRGADRGIPLVEDLAASRNHAVFAPHRKTHTIVDEGSANGTFLNTAPVTNKPRPLQAGDVVLVGRTELRYDPVI